MMHNGNWHNGMDGGGSWWWMAIVMVIFWGGLIALAIAFIRRPHHAMQPAAPGAQAILAERLARGEIEADEYRSRLDALKQ
jgi:putative membrane protein